MNIDATIEGKIIVVSSPKEYHVDKTPSNYRSNTFDYYHVIVKELGGAEIMIYLPVHVIGLINLDKSVVYCMCGDSWKKTVMLNPKKYIGKDVIVEGTLTDWYYMTRVTSIKIKD
jgi:hypothetical protein